MFDVLMSADALRLFRLILGTPWMRELSVVEQRYQTVLAVISDGLSISQVASKVGGVAADAACVVGPHGGGYQLGPLKATCRLNYLRSVSRCGGSRHAPHLLLAVGDFEESAVDTHRCGTMRAILSALNATSNSAGQRVFASPTAPSTMVPFMDVRMK